MSSNSFRNCFSTSSAFFLRYGTVAVRLTVWKDCGADFGKRYGTVAVRNSVNETGRLRYGMDSANGAGFKKRNGCGTECGGREHDVNKIERIYCVNFRFGFNNK